jgi:DNA-binding transcriptional regulator GbsR (MarR family)
MTKDSLKKDLIAAYSDAYQNLGYSSLMGKMVALLIVSPKELSLDDIAEELQMSKGPISQIATRLKEHKLIEKVWVPGERKVFYKATTDIFGQAFKNYTSSMRRNRRMGEDFTDQCEALTQDSEITHFSKKMKEMTAFYTLMNSYHEQFLSAWEDEKTKFSE